MSSEEKSLSSQVFDCLKLIYNSFDKKTIYEFLSNGIQCINDILSGRNGNPFEIFQNPNRSSHNKKKLKDEIKKKNTEYEKARSNLMKSKGADEMAKNQVIVDKLKRELDKLIDKYRRLFNEDPL